MRIGRSRIAVLRSVRFDHSEVVHHLLQNSVRVLFSFIIINMLIPVLCNFLLYLTLILCDKQSFLPKCCEDGEVLSQNISCNNSKVEYNHYEVLGEVKGFLKNCTTDNCLDFWAPGNKSVVVSCNNVTVTDVEKTAKFHKCCPRDYSYNTTMRGCVRENNTKKVSQFRYNYLKIGLSSCKTPITDYTAPTLEKLEEIHNYTALDFNAYCLDVTPEENKFVLRICHANYEICKLSSMVEGGARCMRKCCPDGYMYYKSTICQPKFQNGLNFEDKRILKSKSSNGKCRILVSSLPRISFVLFFIRMNELLRNKLERNYEKSHENAIVFSPHIEIICIVLFFLKLISRFFFKLASHLTIILRLDN